jgi:membrane protease YdiL (CAAX protease family)
MASQGLFSAFWLLVNVVFFLVGLYVYVALIRQISVRDTTSADGLPRTFGLPEAIIAILLMSLLLLNVVVAMTTPMRELNNRDLAANLVITGVIVLILLGFLTLRGFDLNALAGLSKIGTLRATMTGALLLVAAYPLIALADIITQRLLHSGSSRQNIVELFNDSNTMQQRVMIIIMAVAVAPIAEELVFRFFLYGVLKRYVGIFSGIIGNALLFGIVHQHLPSFGPLFVLGCCFTIAYEWSGSILVPMTMHSLFNSVSLVLLAYPGASE